MLKNLENKWEAWVLIFFVFVWDSIDWLVFFRKCLYCLCSSNVRRLRTIFLMLKSSTFPVHSCNWIVVNNLCSLICNTVSQRFVTEPWISGFSGPSPVSGIILFPILFTWNTALQNIIQLKTFRLLMLLNPDMPSFSDVLGIEQIRMTIEQLAYCLIQW